MPVINFRLLFFYKIYFIWELIILLIRMGFLMKKVVAILTNEFNKIEDIEGIILNGSVGRNQYDEVSDLDLCIYHNHEIDFNSVQNVIKKHFDVVYSLDFENKYVYFIKILNTFLQLELSVYHIKNLKDSIIYTIESLISEKNLPNVILLDKRGLILKGYKNYWKNIEENSEFPVHYDKNKKEFLYYLNLLYLNLYRKDLFRSYGLYSICIWLLGNLIAISKGEKRNLYHPKLLMKKLNQDERSELDFLINLSEVNSIKYKLTVLSDLYLKYISDIEKKSISSFKQELILIKEIRNKYNI